jgi:hypothetical protein
MHQTTMPNIKLVKVLGCNKISDRKTFPSMIGYYYISIKTSYSTTYHYC